MSRSLADYAEEINATAHEKGWWDLPQCAHEQDQVLGDYLWCMDCGSIKGLTSGTNRVWQAPDLAKERNIGEVLMLIVTEVAEAYEEVRNHVPLDSIYFHDEHGLVLKSTPDQWVTAPPTWKPEGPAVEMADVVIRILDYCREKGVPLEAAMDLKVAYNHTRPYRHGGKAS